MRSWQVLYAGRQAQCEPAPGERSPRSADTRAKRSEPTEKRIPEDSAETGVLVTIDIPGATPQEPRDPC
ncbi:hypothetical protein O3Q52_49740 [Streptomyces sp. ActVer]|uniref:hypothetical protein n=1 Tax=Streptomyces sp. ActVer TaxID=3014558 RepID=UPI0022B2B0C4|nr:hypothetical protein [Streptomyces sp. ActVer]MCZ4516057.1 hypothetical protein [Streptomyces sp. ActVer]